MMESDVGICLPFLSNYITGQVKKPLQKQQFSSWKALACSEGKEACEESLSGKFGRQLQV